MRLAALSDWLEGRDYLENRFTVADLLMTTVLRILRHTDVVTQMPTLEAYRLRCEARPAFARALAAQMADFTDDDAGRRLAHATPAQTASRATRRSRMAMERSSTRE